MFGLIAAVAVAPSARAQQATPTPAPPTVITLPDTGTGTFSLAPRATPTPTPTPMPIATPTPVEVPPAAASARVQRRPGASPVAALTPTPTPVATATAEPAPLPGASPIATAMPLPASAPATPQRPWLWALLGAAMTALAGLAAWLVLRRRRRDEAEDEVEEVVPVAAPLPPPPPVPPRAAPAPVAPLQSEPFELGIQPLALQLGEREIVLDIELLIANLTGNSADAVRLAAVMISANADQDAQIAAFQANSQFVQATEPFDLGAGAGGRMPIRLGLPRERVQVVTLSGRPMFVPLVMIGIHWRGGLAIRRFGASFMVGTGAQGGKLGPIWLDRPAPRGLAATRYFRREAVAA